MRYLLLVSICLATSGCFPYHYTARPGVAGTVVAAETREPLSGVGISFDRTNVTDFAHTATDGSFSIPPLKQWGIWIVPQDVFVRRYNVSFQHTGYKTQNVEVHSNPAEGGKRAMKQLGVIPLTRFTQ